MNTLIILPEKWQQCLPVCLLLSTFTSLGIQAKSIDDIDVSGYLMLDRDSYDGAFVEHDNSHQQATEIRRARITLKTKIDEYWQTKLQLGFADDDTEIKDAYIQYKGWEWAKLTLGKHKEPFGLERQSSSKNLAIIERSMVSEAISPGRSTGVSLTGSLESLNWQLGYYEPDSDSQEQALTGRLVWTPWQEESDLLHLGVAHSQRRFDDTEFRINEPLEVNFSDSLFESESMIIDESELSGVEFLWQHDKFTTMAEWQQNKVTDVSNNSFDIQGGYVQLSYLIGDGHRVYKNGKPGKVKGTGWEVATRYSNLSIEEEDKDANIYSIGVNYYPTKDLKFMADYIQTEHDNTNSTKGDGHAFSLRAQYSF